MQLEMATALRCDQVVCTYHVLNSLPAPAKKSPCLKNGTPSSDHQAPFYAIGAES